MRWTALEFNREFEAIYNLNKSKNWNDFNNALKDFSAPGQNVVYADINGNIGYVCAAKIPVRANNSPTFIFDGTKSESDWKGFVDYSSMPKLLNPASGFIATANNKTSDNFNYHISNLWEPSSRIENITAKLSLNNNVDTSFCFDLQNDFYSVYAKRITQCITEAFKEVKIKDRNLKVSLNLLAEWDYKMNPQSYAAAIYSHFFQKLMKNIFYDEMGEELFKQYIFIANVPYRVVEDLLAKKTSRWFDNVNTKKTEDMNDIIRKSLVDALVELEKNQGKDPANWQWGNIHKIQFRHVFSSGSGFLSRILDNGPYSVGGDGTTVFNTEYTFNEPFRVKLGPSMRFVYDFSNRNNIKYILPNGQSGHFMSSHYSDMTKLWLNKKYLNLHSDASAENMIDDEQIELIPVIR